jgi:hypothetical protein
MVNARRMDRRVEENDEEIRHLMFLEYREENAKDMEREGGGRW